MLILYLSFRFEESESFNLFTILPVNDQPPVISNTQSRIDFTENQPLQLFSSLDISDSDESCGSVVNSLSQAMLVLQPAPDDMERLLVSNAL